MMPITGVTAAVMLVPLEGWLASICLSRAGGQLGWGCEGCWLLTGRKCDGLWPCDDRVPISEFATYGG